jgi:hypothetical protein
MLSWNFVGSNKMKTWPCYTKHIVVHPKGFDQTFIPIFKIIHSFFTIFDFYYGPKKFFKLYIASWAQIHPKEPKIMLNSDENVCVCVCVSYIDILKLLFQIVLND